MNRLSAHTSPGPEQGDVYDSESVAIQESCLGPYRVLDLTQGGCLLCGKILGDLGADVVVIEKPDGSPSRCLPPFYKDSPNAQKSLQDKMESFLRKEVVENKRI